MGGRLSELWPLEDDEWSEHFFVDGMSVTISGFLCTTIDGWLDDVLLRFDVADDKHMRLAAIADGRALHGAAQLDAWKTRVATYPDGLRAAMLRHHLDCERRWQDADMLADRDERLALADMLVRMERKLMGALLALNRRYAPDSRHKWARRLARQLQLAPDDLASRLVRAWQLQPATAVEELRALFDETVALVETHVPAFDTTFVRACLGHRRSPATPWAHATRRSG